VTGRKMLVGLMFCSLCLTAQASENADSVKLSAVGKSAARVQGWTEQADKSRFFTMRGLFDIIDGGAVEYEKAGLVDGVVVSLSAKPDKTAEIYIEKFKSAGKASAMVGIKKKNAARPKPVPGIRNKNAFLDEVIGGCVVCFFERGLYFEMTLTGYAVAGDAGADAGRFLEAFAKDLRK
jgi:hypothetical protein